MCQSRKNRPAAHDGMVISRLPDKRQLVSVPGVGTVVTVDRTGRAQNGARVTVVQVEGGEWRIV